MLLAAACCSCATKRYVQPSVPPEHCATMEATPPVWIHSIDGRRTPKGFGGATRQLRVPPGEQSMSSSWIRRRQQVHGQGGRGFQSVEEVRIYRSNGRTPTVLKLRPGKVYPIKYELLRRSQRIRSFVLQ